MAARGMRAMVLAAGLGTRLGELSSERPKPLLPVADVPLLRYPLALLRGHGVTEVAINLHHLGELIVAELDGRTPGLHLEWSREAEILGTGGGLRRMAEWLTRGGTEPFLVLNGKVVLDVDLDALAQRHRNTGALATLAVREVPDAERWGAIDLDADGRVAGLLGEAAPGARPVARRTMFTGVHVVSPAVVARLPDGASCIIRQGYLPSLRAGGHLEALTYDGYFQEHSDPARYLEGNRAVLRGEAALRHPPGELLGVDPTAEIGAGARLVEPVRVGAGARIGAGALVGPETVVGSGATVAEHATVARSVVWAHATAEGALDRAIVTPGRVVTVDAPGTSTRS